MFQLEKSTAVICVNANPRRELHGKELVRAIDLTFNVTGGNELLDVLEPGLRRHFYTNKAADNGQIDLGTVVAADLPLPDLRFPLLPTEGIAYGEKTYRGFRWMWDWGTKEDHVDFTDCVVGGLRIVKLEQGGTVTVAFTVKYNGEELDDNEIYGELSGLASEGEVWIKLLAPAELVAVRKGYRAGKPDTPVEPPKDPNQPELRGDGGATGDDDVDVDEALREAGDEQTPEAALAGAEEEHQAAAAGKRKKK
jgi:hypothetical protein